MTTPANYITLNNLGTEILEEFPDTKYIYIYFEENKIWKSSYRNYNTKLVYFNRVEKNNNNNLLSHEEIMQDGIIDIRNPIIKLPKNLNDCLNTKRDRISCIVVDLRKSKEYKGFKYYNCFVMNVKNNMAKQIREQIIEKKEDENLIDEDIYACMLTSIPEKSKSE